MHPAPLNVFQKTQLHWETIHPYNAAQLATLDRAFSTEQLTRAFNHAITDLRLGTFVHVDDRYWIDRIDHQPAQVLVVSDLERFLSEQLNTPFPPLASFPFRPFANGTTIGLIYQHWVADSVSVRTLMRAWLACLLDRSDLSPRPVRLDDRTTLARFSPSCSNWSVVSQASELLGFARSMKRMRRVETSNTDQRVHTRIRALEGGFVNHLRAAAKAHGSTVGDLLLASVTHACATVGPSKLVRSRPDLAMGTIVDLRNRNPNLTDRVFGLYLGFMISTFRDHDLSTFDATIARARTLRLMQTHKHSAEASQLRMWIGLQIARRMPSKSLLEFYRKRFPLAGGISNVNLTGSWMPDVPQIVRYDRISPTGPLMPIVVTPTTLGGAFSLCYTYKTAILDDASAARIVDSMIEMLQR
jgi:NRPS condensation-like uncharacterized protein